MEISKALTKVSHIFSLPSERKTNQNSDQQNWPLAVNMVWLDFAYIYFLNEFDFFFFFFFNFLYLDQNFKNQLEIKFKYHKSNISLWNFKNQIEAKFK